MGQILGIDSYVELQRHVVEVTVDGLSNGKSINFIVESILQTSGAFGMDDVDRPAGPDIPKRWRINPSINTYSVLSATAKEMFLDGIIEGKPITNGRHLPSFVVR